MSKVDNFLSDADYKKLVNKPLVRVSTESIRKVSSKNCHIN